MRKWGYVVVLLALGAAACWKTKPNPRYCEEGGACDGGVDGHAGDASLDLAMHCATNVDCTTATAPTCDVSTGLCGACTANLGCAGHASAPTCDTTTDRVRARRDVHRLGHRRARTDRGRRAVRTRGAAPGPHAGVRWPERVARARPDRGARRTARVVRRVERVSGGRRDVGARRRAVRSRSRTLPCGRDGAAGAPGVTVLGDGLVVARALSDSAEAVRDLFHELWTIIRPAMTTRRATSPRIWAT